VPADLDRVVDWGVTAPDRQTFDVVEAETAHVGALFEIFTWCA
jgi:hypothetical protein